MKKLLPALAILFFIVSCSPEEVEQTTQENIILNAMTNGQWKVTSFIKGSSNVTTDFALYKFQFHKTLTVDAILVSNNAVEKSGTWNADAVAKTITSHFTNANATLTLLNGTWLITKNSFTYVEASQTVGGEMRTLRLDKL